MQEFSGAVKFILIAPLLIFIVRTILSFIVLSTEIPRKGIAIYLFSPIAPAPITGPYNKKVNIFIDPT